MTTIYLMRHGYAEPSSPAGDASRQLTEDGMERIKWAGLALARAGVQPDVILCSPRVRAHQTAQIMGEALGKAPEVRDSVNFDFEVGVVYNVIEDVGGMDVMFVGHEPTMSATVYALTGGAVVMHPGTVVAIHMSDETGAIEWMLSPVLAEGLGTDLP